MIARRLTPGLSLMLALAACLACAGAQISPGVTPTFTPAESIAESCRTESRDGVKVTIVPHDGASPERITAIQGALTAAFSYSSQAYGWAPEEPICVHTFPDAEALIDGLITLAGIDPTQAQDYRGVFGTVGRDVESGLDSIYLNTTTPLGPNWEPNVATHEYFHIVEGHVAETMGGPQPSFPTWFWEGVADWEAVKLQGAPFPGWLSLLKTEVRSGTAPALSSLVTWEQWRRSGTPANPGRGLFKARAAAMFLEETAGPTAAVTVLRDNRGGDLTSFENVFRRVSGLDLQQFEERLTESLSAEADGAAGDGLGERREL